MENTSNPNIFALQVDAASLNGIPPGEIRVSPSNPYASTSSDPPLSSTAGVSGTGLQLDLHQLGSEFNTDLDAFSSFFNEYTAAESALKDDLFGGEGIEDADPGVNDGSVNPSFGSGFDFELGFDPNGPLPGFADEGFLGHAPDMAHSQFIDEGEYDFGNASRFVNKVFGQLQAQAGPSNSSGGAPGLGRGIYIPQSQLLPTPPDTESSPRSAGSMGERHTATSPVEVRPRSYMPPPGALNASMRRAAGTWRPPVNLRDDDDE